ncbi:MAG: phosphate ABC transporter permease subunit PstC [Solirubrobacterales bacterium]
MESGLTTFSDAPDLSGASRGVSGDRVLLWSLRAIAWAILALLLFFLLQLIIDSREVFSTMGLNFLVKNDWDVSRDIYGALPLIVGTLITSALALIIGVPIAVASAVYLTELCPPRFRRGLTALLELLAAVPSVVYGLWAFFVLIPLLKPAMQWVDSTFAFLPFLGSDQTISGPSYFMAGLVLAIMILPIVSAVSREVLVTVPREQREAALALGATRWETIWQAVLPPARDGIFSAAILGLGRAIGETIAVTIVIGNAAVIGDSLFSQGYTLAAVIANEFGEAASQPLHRSALIASGLVLLVLTLFVNVIADLIVNRTERRMVGKKRGPTVV